MADLDRGQSGTSIGSQVKVGHTRRPHDNQGARLQRDQFLTQELTYFVLDTGEPSETGNPANTTHDSAHENANVYLTGYHANGEMRPAEKIINVLSSFMNPVIVEAIDIVDGTGADAAAREANTRGNTRLLYFACEVDGLHWDSDDDADGDAYDTYGEIGANTMAGNAEMSTAAQAIRAIRALDSTDLAKATLSRGYFRVSTASDTSAAASITGVAKDNSIS